MKIIITAPSLNPKENVSGISSVVQFIINNNPNYEYIHFEVGKKDAESSNAFSRVKRILKNRKDWKKLLLENRSAQIHYNMPLMGAAIIRDFLLLQVAHSMGLPIVLHIHGGRLMNNRNRPWIINKILNLLFGWAKHIIVLSDVEKQIIEEDFHVKNVHSLPNCIDLSEARVFNRKRDLSKPLSLLYLGRIEKNKGIDYILEATKHLKNEGVDFVLNFAGMEENEGEYIPTFQQELGDRFIYQGVVYGQLKTDLLKSCEVFLLPSFYEGLPMSLIETMSFGMVPIVTKVGSISTIVNDNKNGLFINVKDANDIVMKIKLLLSNNGLLNDLSINAKNRVLEIFDDKAYIEKLNTLYKV